MGRTNIYGDANEAYITPTPQANSYFFGFRTKIDEAEGAQLGHLLTKNATPLLPIIFGLNSPKPAKYKKAATSYSITSYGDANATIPNTWKKIRKIKMRKATSSEKSMAVSVAFNGAKYCWNMLKAVYDAIGTDKAGLGIADALGTLAAAKDQIWGGNGVASQPPKASKFDSTNNSTITTFYDASKTLPTGWSPAKGGYEQ